MACSRPSFISCLEEAEDILMEQADPVIVKDVLLCMGIVTADVCQDSCTKSEQMKCLISVIKSECTDQQFTDICDLLEKQGDHVTARIMQHGPDYLTQSMSADHQAILTRLQEPCSISCMTPQPLVIMLYSRGALTLHQRELIEVQPTRTDQCCLLLDIVKGQPDWTYCCLLDALIKSEQCKVMDIINNRHSSPMHPLQKSIDSCMHGLCKDLDLTELLPKLQSQQVLTSIDVQNITAAPTDFKQNCHLLDCLRTKTEQQVNCFIQSLIDTGQRHIARRIDPSIPEIRCVAPVAPPRPRSLNSRKSKLANSPVPERRCSNPIAPARTRSFNSRKSKMAASLDCLRNSLAQMYMSRYKRIVLWGTGVNPVQEQFEAVYTDMTWVKVKRGAEVMERGQLDHYTDMLKCETNQHVLIWGEAGIGKTVFCQKLCQDWALSVRPKETEEHKTTNETFDKLEEDQQQILSKIELLFYIVLRDTNENQSLEQVISNQLSKESSFRMCYRPKNTLILFDGLDELAYEKSELLDIIYGKMYPDVKCIVTCRPHASLGLSLSSDSEIRLRGFTLDQAKHFVLAYFLCKYDSEEISRKKSEQCWKMIEKSSDLKEMATNPSMLQLMCLLYYVTGKIGKDRASLFKDYTQYLLHKYHQKETGKKSPVSNLLELPQYKEQLIATGNLALSGLKQSHLQLIFNKDKVIKTVGDKPFQIGFLTEIPSLDPSQSKVQFLHKSLQEYLAAYAVVNSPEDQGLQLLMQFCSSSQGLMGSQIILTFIRAMSKKMGSMIQRKIEEFVKSWEHCDQVNPEERVSFLLTMLKENKNLTFPLPKEIVINFKDYENVFGGLNKKVMHFLGKKTLLDTFFNLNTDGVTKIQIGLGSENRLKLLKMTGLEEMIIDFQYTSAEKDVSRLVKLFNINSNLKRASLLRLERFQLSQLFNDQPFLDSLEALQNLELNISGTAIDTKIAEAVSQLPKNIQFDISDCAIYEKNKKVLLNLLPHIKRPQRFDFSRGGIEIDEKVMQVISSLPEKSVVNLSGNKIRERKIYNMLLSKVEDTTLPALKNRNNPDLERNEAIEQALCDPLRTMILDLSHDNIAMTNTHVPLCFLPCIKKNSTLDFSNFDLRMDIQFTRFVSKLPSNTAVYMSGNKFIGRTSFLTLINNARHLSKLHLQDCEVSIDAEMAKAFSLFPENFDIDLSGNKIQGKEKELLLHVVPRFKQGHCFDFSNAGIEVDENVIRIVSSLPEGSTIDLSENLIKDKEIYKQLVKESADKDGENKEDDHTDVEPNKELETAFANCNLCARKDFRYPKTKMNNCQVPFLFLPCFSKPPLVELGSFGLEIDYSFAQCVSNVPPNTLLDLSNNGFQDKSAVIQLINNSHHLSRLGLQRCGISIDSDITEALCGVPEKVEIDLSANFIQTKTKQVLLKVLPHFKQADKFDFSFGLIDIVEEVMNIVSNLPEGSEINLSGNKVTSRSVYQLLRDKASCINKVPVPKDKSYIGENQHIQKAFEESNLCLKLDFSQEKVKMKNTLVPFKLLPCIKGANTFDLSGFGLRINQTFANCISNMPPSYGLNLSGNIIPEKSVCIDLMNNSRQLCSINLQRCGLQIDTEIAEAVIQLATQAELNLSRNVFIDKASCISLIRNSHRLSSLNLEKCGIEIDDEIAEVVSNLPETIDISLADNKLVHMNDDSLVTIMSKAKVTVTEETLIKISSIPKDKDISVAENSIDMSTWYTTITFKILEGLSRFKGLTHLNANKNKFSPVAMEKLPGFMEFFPELKELHLSYCGLDDEDSTSLTSSLSTHCSKIETLNLSNNEVKTATGMYQIVGTLKQMKQLRLLKLRGNPCVKDSVLMKQLKQTLADTNTQLKLEWK